MISSTVGTWFCGSNTDQCVNGIPRVFTLRWSVISLNGPGKWCSQRFLCFHPDGMRFRRIDADWCADSFFWYFRWRLKGRAWLVSFPAASTRSLGIKLERSADDVYSYRFPNQVCGVVEWMQKGVLGVSGVFARVVLFFCLQRVCNLFGWTHKDVLIVSHFLTHREYVIFLDRCRILISPFFPRRKWVISLYWYRMVCSWDPTFFCPQEVRNLVGSMQNSMFMGSPRFSPHSVYVIWLDQCRIVCS